MNNNDYCISAGEFAKLCKTTRDTLRYYDKMGILIPYKNDENGYNYYSPRQISSFYFISFYRALQCPVKQLKEFMAKPDSDDFYNLMNNQYNSLLEMKNEIENKLELLSIGIDMANHIKKNPNGKVILEDITKPLRVFYTKIESSPSKKFDEITSDVTRHINVCNELKYVKAFPMGGVISKDTFFKGDYTYTHVFSMVDDTSSDVKAGILPGNRIVSCVSQDSNEDIYDIYKRIQDFITDNNLTVKSDIHSLSLMNIVDSNQNNRYLKYIFACV